MSIGDCLEKLKGLNTCENKREERTKKLKKNEREKEQREKKMTVGDKRYR